MEKVYKPQTITDQPFIGPVEPSNKPNSTSTTFYPATVQNTPFPRPSVASKVISSNLNTQSRKILGAFSFGRVGAIQIGSYQSGASGDIRISPNGIVGRNSSGSTTFSIDGTTGNATFMGTLAAGSIIASSVTVDWAQITNVEVENADIVSLNADKITAGTLSADRIGAASITASKLSVSTLSAITANIGAITSGSITGVTITGGTVRTAASGARIQLDSNYLSVYNSGGTLIGGLEPTSGVILADGDWNFVDSVSFDAIDAASLLMFGAVDMNGQDVNNVDVIEFSTRSSNPSDSWCIYAYSSGGTYQLRVRLNGSTYSADLTPA